VKDKTANAGNISLDKPQKPLLMIVEPLITLSVFHFFDKKSATRDVQRDTHLLFCLLVSRQYPDREPQAVPTTPLPSARGSAPNSAAIVPPFPCLS
jgi:hypothetical protein